MNPRTARKQSTVDPQSRATGNALLIAGLILPVFARARGEAELARRWANLSADLPGHKKTLEV